MPTLRKLVLVALIVTMTGCVPPPPPPAPPPTTTARRYVPCGSVDGYSCMAYSVSESGYTWGFGQAKTTNGATYITIELSLYRQVDGGWTLVWQESPQGRTGTTFAVESPPIACQHGYYRWEVRVHFASVPRTTFTHQETAHYL